MLSIQIMIWEDGETIKLGLAPTEESMARFTEAPDFTRAESAPMDRLSQS